MLCEAKTTGVNILFEYVHLIWHIEIGCLFRGKPVTESQNILMWKRKTTINLERVFFYQVCNLHRYCAKNFVYIFTFNSHNNLMQNKFCNLFKREGHSWHLSLTTKTFFFFLNWVYGERDKSRCFFQPLLADRALIPRLFPSGSSSWLLSSASLGTWRPR